jgi:F-type H+-transporting ATPase subunit b
MESLITTFHIDWKIIIAQVINFGIVFLVLYLFALKPLKKMMAEREEKISRGLTDAYSNAEMLAKTRQEYAEIINKARAEAQVLFEQGKKEAEMKKAEMLQNTKKEIDLMIMNGQKNLELEKARIMESAKKDMVHLVIRATEKIMEDKEGIESIK